MSTPAVLAPLVWVTAAPSEPRRGRFGRGGGQADAGDVAGRAAERNVGDDEHGPAGVGGDLVEIGDLRVSVPGVVGAVGVGIDIDLGRW